MPGHLRQRARHVDAADVVEDAGRFTLDFLAVSPSRAPAHPKKTRAVGSIQAALAAAANPRPPSA